MMQNMLKLDSKDIVVVPVGDGYGIVPPDGRTHVILSAQAAMRLVEELIILLDETKGSPVEGGLCEPEICTCEEI